MDAWIARDAIQRQRCVDHMRSYEKLGCRAAAASISSFKHPIGMRAERWKKGTNDLQRQVEKEDRR